MIGPVLEELVGKIVSTYRFYNLPNIDSLKKDCQSYLITVLDKYNPNKSKAFAYFSVVTKNWFIHRIKKHSKQNSIETPLEDVHGELSDIAVTNGYHERRESDEFWEIVLENVDDWEYEANREQEKQVIKAVKVLMESIDEIDIFNKKAVYLYLRELTGLNTKQVVNNLNKIRKKYRQLRRDYDKGDI